MHKKQKKRTAFGAFFGATTSKSPVLVTLMGLEPMLSAWEANVLGH